GRQAPEAGGSGTALSAAAGGGGAPRGRIALTAATSGVSAAPVDAPAAEAENPGSVADLAAGADGAATRPLGGGRPALDRPGDARVSHPAGGPGAHGSALGPADVSA